MEVSYNFGWNLQSKHKEGKLNYTHELIVLKAKMTSCLERLLFLKRDWKKLPPTISLENRSMSRNSMLSNIFTIRTASQAYSDCGHLSLIRLGKLTVNQSKCCWAASRHNGMKGSGCPDGRTPPQNQSGEMSGRNIYSEQQTNLSDKHIVSRYPTQGFGLSSWSRSRAHIASWKLRAQGSYQLGRGVFCPLTR